MVPFSIIFVGEFCVTINRPEVSAVPEDKHGVLRNNLRNKMPLDGIYMHQGIQKMHKGS